MVFLVVHKALGPSLSPNPTVMTSGILVLGRSRQGDLEFKVILGNIAALRLGVELDP